MRLDAWLSQSHTSAERLRLIERLAQALNGVHDRGETLASIAPERVEVGNDQRCDLSPAARGRLEPGYAAPERLEGGSPSTAADIYSVGALCWEILMGRPCGEAPKPLPEIAPELPRELANSVMGCLERSPEWRPKDLTYLAQLAAAQQKASRGPELQSERAKAPPRSSSTPRSSAAPRSNALPRTPPRRASRSHLPLFVAAVLLVAAAASSYLWLHRQEAAPAVAAKAVPPPAPVATPQPGPTPAATPAPIAPTTPRAAPSAPGAAPTPTPAASVPMQGGPEPTPEPTPESTPTPAPVVAPTPEPREASAAPAEPASLMALSPLSVRRPGKVLLDIRGAGLRSDQRVRILPLKAVPRGITVVRQKWTSPNLVTVLLDLDASVTPAVYAIALEDTAGGLTNPLQLNVTK